jgi:hypothetical protein
MQNLVIRARTYPDLVFLEQSDGLEAVKKELKKFKILIDSRFAVLQREKKQCSSVCDCFQCEKLKFFEEHCVPHGIPNINSPWFEAWNFHNRSE